MKGRVQWEALSLAGPGFLLIAGLLLIPLARVLWMSFSEPVIGFQNYEPLIESSGLRTILYTTFEVAFITTTISCALAFSVALVLHFTTERVRKVMFFMILVPLWLSSIVRIFDWLIIMERNGLLNSALLTLKVISEPLAIDYTMFAVLVGMVHYMLPYAILPIYSNMREVDPQLIRAARGLGATRGIILRKIFLPLCFPGIVAAAALVFILSLGFYVLPFILGGGRVTMLGEYIAVNMLDTGNWGVASMVAVVLLILILIIYGATRGIAGSSMRVSG